MFVGVTVSSSQTPSNDLRYALVKVTSFSYCQSKYGSSLDSTMICAGTSDGKDACQGEAIYGWNTEFTAI